MENLNRNKKNSKPYKDVSKNMIIIGIAFMLLPLLIIAFSAYGIYYLYYHDTYSEAVFEDYCNQKYNDAFEDSEYKNDYFMLVIIVEDSQYNSFWNKTHLGDHLNLSARNVLEGYNSKLNNDLLICVNISSYKYSLGSDLASAIVSVTDALCNEDNNFYVCSDTHDNFAYLENASRLDVDSAELQSALNYFVAKTNIPIHLVIEDYDEVFKPNTNFEKFPILIGVIIFSSILIILGFCVVVKGLRKSNDSDINNSSLEEFDSMIEEIVDEFKIDPKDY